MIVESDGVCKKEFKAARPMLPCLFMRADIHYV